MRVTARLHHTAVFESVMHCEKWRVYVIDQENQIDPDPFEKHCDAHPISIAILLQTTPCSWQKVANIINTLFLQNWGFYELNFGGDGPHFFKEPSP